MTFELQSRHFEIAKIARELMDQHGLKKWEFMWDTTVWRAGLCNYKAKVISLSAYVCLHRTIEATRDTILHEIAHALVGPGHGHDKVWKAKAIEIGCDGKRCYSDQVPKKYMAQCKNGHTLGIQRFDASKRYSCPLCSNKYNPEYGLQFKINPDYKPPKRVPPVRKVA